MAILCYIAGDPLTTESQRKNPNRNVNLQDERGVYSIRVQQIYRVRQRCFFLRIQIALAQNVYS